ncbi:DUF418 domain-containing protein [Allonocardiopsis opalescens]|uniref:DUF418 domain-containing protein n=1 Tax=Allonocardiopsis opalescens TaxID=1144618 RepID=A0A2T0PXN9_9ACTN|nr:DUF418 domain-containing protein [Allonocardiopsis opalescens]PRX96310.1 uncharacterized protein CLV72_108317 [Allonocardiopsis opalescens]
MPNDGTAPTGRPRAAEQGGGRRIDALDVLRGVAILGTLGTNIWIFTDPDGPAGFLAGLPAPDSVAGTAETVLRFLANGKFLALLTLLFGIGLELQYRSALRRGRRWPGWYLWRAALLFTEGVLHFVLVFEFDVLMGYAVVSMLVAYLIGRRALVVGAWAGVAAVLHLASISLLTAALVVLPDSVRETPEPLVGLYAHGGYPEQVAVRLSEVLVYRSESVFIVPLGIVLFLAGSRLHRAGVLADTVGGARLRRRLMALGLGIGVPANLATSLLGPDWFLADRYLCAPLVALGLLGLVPALVLRSRRGPGPVRRALGAVGRTALSSYVGQNVIASVLCYGWGLGLAATLADWRPWWVLAAWAAICVLQLLLASWWLRRFERGPLELAWHWAYLAPQRRGRARPPSGPGAGTETEQMGVAR